MKRIDDKIKEIEKKDKTNRILYIAFVVLIGAFIAYALTSEKTKGEQREKLNEQDIKLSATYLELESQKNSIANTLKALEDAMDPNEYWKHIQDESSVEAYIEYITNDWGIKKPFMTDALKKLQDGGLDTELEGFLYVGKIVSSEFQDQRVNVVWRENVKDIDNNVLPVKGDIIQLKKQKTMKTYFKPKQGGRSNGQGWRKGTKAYVSEVRTNQNGAEVWVKIKYY